MAWIPAVLPLNAGWANPWFGTSTDVTSRPIGMMATAYSWTEMERRSSSAFEEQRILSTASLRTTGKPGNGSFSLPEGELRRAEICHLNRHDSKNCRPENTAFTRARRTPKRRVSVETWERSPPARKPRRTSAPCTHVKTAPRSRKNLVSPFRHRYNNFAPTDPMAAATPLPLSVED